MWWGERELKDLTKFIDKAAEEDPEQFMARYNGQSGKNKRHDGKYFSCKVLQKVPEGRMVEWLSTKKLKGKVAEKQATDLLDLYVI